jgi:hypothetical protein
MPQELVPSQPQLQFEVKKPCSSSVAIEASQALGALNIGV